MIRRADLVVIGYGNVARRFVELLRDQARRLREEFALECRIAGTSTRRSGSFFDDSPCTGAFEVIERLATSDAALRIVVETSTLDVRNGEPAVSHVRTALERGCHVVTANKGPVAFAYAALRDEARRRGNRFLFEGAVMDGIPIFNLVRETMPLVAVTGFEGVVNTTTNHILTAMEQGTSFDAALAEMQDRGIAEADASLDVDGWDAAAKTAALANALMDAGITPHDVDRTGIGPETAAAALDALSRGRRLKIVASARRDHHGRLVCTVAPRELPREHLLATLGGDANALVLETDLLDRVAICQLSGDLTQTAYALLADIVTIAKEPR